MDLNASDFNLPPLKEAPQHDDLLLLFILNQGADSV